MENPRQMNLIPEVREGVRKHYENAKFLYRQVHSLFKNLLNDGKIYVEDCYYEVDLKQDKYHPNRF